MTATRTLALTAQMALMALMTAAYAAPPREPLAAGLIVKYRSELRTPQAAEVAMQGLRASAEARGLAVAHEREGVLGTRVLRLHKPHSARELQRLARDLQAADASIEYAEPDWLLHRNATVSDPGWLEQWNLQQFASGIEAEGAWDYSQGSGIRVAVLDTGVLPHADLQANLLVGYDFVTSLSISRDGDGRDADASDPGDWSTVDNECKPDTPAAGSSWHGKHVAGIVAASANNGIGYSGVAPKAKILPVRVLGRCGSGATSDIAAGLLWAAGGSVSGAPANPTPARVLNLSLGGEGACATTMQNAVDAARARGALVVASAGNDNRDAALHQPSNCRGVVAVGASTFAGGRAAYSNFGNALSLSAPGGDDSLGVPSTVNTGSTLPVADSYSHYFGTSMAAPHVAGTAALMFSVNSGLPADIAHRLMVKTAKPFKIACTVCGSGILNARAAVQAARGWRAEREPNEGTAQAQYLNVFPARVSGTIEPTATQALDHYSVYLAPGAQLAVQMEMLDLPGYVLSTSLELLNASGQLLQKGQTAGPLTQLLYQNIGSQGLTLILRVRGTASFGSGSVKSYRYELLFNRS